MSCETVGLKQNRVDLVPCQDRRDGFDKTRVRLFTRDNQGDQFLSSSKGTRHHDVLDPEVKNSQVTQLDGDLPQRRARPIRPRDQLLDGNVERPRFPKQLRERRLAMARLEVRDLGLRQSAPRGQLRLTGRCQ